MTITMGIFRSQTISANSHPPKVSDDVKEPKMGVLRSQTVAHLSSHFHKSSSSKDFKEQAAPELGIVRSCTDPLDKKTSKDSRKSNDTQTAPSSENSSGTNTPNRKSLSMERVRSIYERPSSVIPKYYVVAEQVHRFKMRKCEGMRCSDEEGTLIKKMQKWDWKHATHPGEAALPVGPKNESWHFEGVAWEQIQPHSHHGAVDEDGK